ncbi:MAG: hypothetical protein DMG49_20540 [Acidobacteria bacterium]|nr:MAG: hypothetical protein DMG49_20540 [Acidobacteriota bacterium]
MKRFLPVLCLCLFFYSLIPAQEKTSTTAKPKNIAAADGAREDTNPSAAKLPVRRVVLYKNGVGYFEHLGHVRSSQDVHVDFTSAQLNDALKSLTVLDLSGGRITGSATISTTGAGERNLYLSYISEVPIGKSPYRIVLSSKAD